MTDSVGIRCPGRPFSPMIEPNTRAPLPEHDPGTAPLVARDVATAAPAAEPVPEAVAAEVPPGPPAAAAVETAAPVGDDSEPNSI